ncbi:hypothetical protein BC940DRAFT_349729 [Gongronella butleri]|nr:hypothetical protein BC940DRAFT_349729 [Gongronella butleri]
MDTINVFSKDTPLGEPFVEVERLDITQFSRDDLFGTIQEKCLKQGLPLVFYNLDKLNTWKSDVLSFEYVASAFGENDITAVDVKDYSKKMTGPLKDYMARLARFERKLHGVNASDDERCDDLAVDAPGNVKQEADQPNSSNTSSIATSTRMETTSRSASTTRGHARSRTRARSQRLQQKNNQQVTHPFNKFYYAKDLDCPPSYNTQLADLLPSYLLPLGDLDLFSVLPKHLQPINLMCYIGGTGSGTPMHCDIAGTIGHNIMTSSSSKSAYAQWVMVPHHRSARLHPICNEVQGLARNAASDFVDSERAWITLDQLKDDAVPTYIVRQRPGEMVLVPPLCFHQVTNVGVSVKIAWNRMSEMSLLRGIKSQLPMYQKICRPEVYKCKAAVYFALKNLLNTMPTPVSIPDEQKQAYFFTKCNILLDLFAREVLAPEMIEPVPTEDVYGHDVQQDKPLHESYDYAFDVVCDFCRSDVFHRYYHCDQCKIDLCLKCYAYGRSCAHLVSLIMHEPESTPSNDLGVPESKLYGPPPLHPPPKNRLERYAYLYNCLIDTVNQTFGRTILNSYGSILQTHSSEYSLATVCRRIEKYRYRNGYLCNKLYCHHCHTVFDMDELLIKHNITMFQIFQRRPCTLTISQSGFAFTCTDCAQDCPGCQPLERKLDAKKSQTSCYFTDTSQYLEFFGGSQDPSLYQGFSWPSYKLNKPEPSVKSALLGKQWMFPQDFMQLAAEKLISRITDNGWHAWATNKCKSNWLSRVLANSVLQWKKAYEPVLTEKKFLNPDKEYPYTMPAEEVKTWKIWADLTNLSLRVPTDDEILTQRTFHDRRYITSSPISTTTQTPPATPLEIEPEMPKIAEASSRRRITKKQGATKRRTPNRKPKAPPKDASDEVSDEIPVAGAAQTMDVSPIELILPDQQVNIKPPEMPTTRTPSPPPRMPAVAAKHAPDATVPKQMTEKQPLVAPIPASVIPADTHRPESPATTATGSQPRTNSPKKSPRAANTTLQSKTSRIAPIRYDPDAKLPNLMLPAFDYASVRPPDMRPTTFNSEPAGTRLFSYKQPIPHVDGSRRASLNNRLTAQTLKRLPCHTNTTIPQPLPRMPAPHPPPAISHGKRARTNDTMVDREQEPVSKQPRIQKGGDENLRHSDLTRHITLPGLTVTPLRTVEAAPPQTAVHHELMDKSAPHPPNVLDVCQLTGTRH